MSEVKKLIAELRRGDGNGCKGPNDVMRRAADALEALDSAPPVAHPLPDREQLAVAIMAALDELWASDGRVLGKLHTRDEILAAIETAPAVSDDTEWEYAWQHQDPITEEVFFSEKNPVRIGYGSEPFSFLDWGWGEKAQAASDTVTKVRRRKAGPWVAIEKGGESNDN